MREIARRTGLAIGSVRQEALKLVRLGLILSRKSGNRTYYESNKKHPLYPDICRIVLKTSGLADVLRQALGDEGIRCAFVFGSVAAGTTQAESDVDLMVIGDIGLREISKRLSGVGQRIGREINPHAMTPAELAKRRRASDHFVLSVMQAPRIWIGGTENELEAMGG
jgi:predicted nucleotidyltransferase